MRRIVSWLALGLLFSTTTQGGPDTNCLPGFNWPVGEKLTYQLYWGFIPVGTANVWTEWTEAADGRRLLAIRMRTTSNKVIEKIYPVDDTIESLVDPGPFLPVQFSKNMSEGTHRYHEVTVFDRTNLIARWESKLTGKKRVFRIEPDTRDIPTFMFSMRGQSFEPGHREHFRVMADEKIYDLWLDIKKKEKVDLDAYSDVACVKIEPEAAFNGLFVRKGKIWAWISTDPRCLAARVEASIPVANIHALLLKVEGPGSDFWVKSREKK
jgi:hypothetical protein